MDVATVLVRVLEAAASWVLGPWIALYALVVAHESAHAIVGRLLGLDVLTVDIGAGPSWFAFRLGRCEVILRRAPRHGFTVAVPRSVRWLRTRMVAVLLAGPIVDVAAFTALLGASVITWQLVQQWHLGWFGLALATLCVGVVAVQNLVPRTFRVRDEEFPSDLMHVVRFLRMDDPALARVIAETRLVSASHEFWRLLLSGRVAAAREQARARQDEPSQVWVPLIEESLAACLEDGPSAALERNARAEAAIADLCATESADAPDPASAAALRAWTTINRMFFLAWSGDPDDLRQADALAASHAFDAGVAGRRTRGFLRLRQGRPVDALADLEKAWRMQEPPWCRSLCAAHIAQAQAQLGRAGAMRRWLRRARRLAPRSPLLPQLTRAAEESLLQKSAAA